MVNKVNKNVRFGNLIVLELLNDYYIEPNGHRRRKVLVKCDCSSVFEIIGATLLKSGQKCKSCKFTKNCIVTINQTYDKLKVINFTYVNGRKEAVCECICGKIVNRRPELLARVNMTNNCGCEPRGSWKGVGSLSQTFFGRIKRSAKIRNFDFDISIKYAWELYEKQNGKCALTGLDIPFGENTTDKNDASLDRIDSSLGYTKDNIQWVHKDINIMKMDMNQEEFIKMCKLVCEKFKP